MGFYMFKWRKGHIQQATIGGVIGMILCVVLGERVAASSFASWFVLSHHQLTALLVAYGFAASVLPVWMLLTPRDYISTFMKIGTIGLLAIGVIIVNPTLQMPAVTQYVGGGGPIFSGPLFPFVFITIACGAISGFHGLIGSGTTPKMVDKESDIRPVGYGAMLCEGMVGVMALVAATALHPNDYYAINATPAVYQTLKDSTGAPMQPVHLPELERAVGENVVGRTGGGVSLAIGMADIFSRLPGMRGLLAYWYHFAIMFEALFILTTIDAGTRVARFALQEFVGRVYKPFARTDWLPGSLISTSVICLAWGYFIWTGSIDTIWPMFGVSNQLLAGVALGGRDDDPHQHGQGQIRVGDVPAVVVRDGDDADRRLHERARHLLAAGHRPQPGAPHPGVHPHHFHGDHDGAGRDDPRVRGMALPAGADRTRAATRRGEELTL